ncbi:hypothetical protein [Helicobacter canadensis]|uniref:Lipoprotein n=1 Tax=Helicobacter canadensis MIT 98-5491 TaxID=537970 RepID=C5ZXH2_9HELI|nr:hypothetical protein [Helicobacter canadensis]EES89840.1 conserved hypothetical protein [Helicobacter canadensis MIT 98-5491]EFR48639.1 hypothetical protein HCMG_00812 [Helicobacter canadensis MIT 98-5491]STO99882.1 Uncharacterised protein [Helicobacter canadensis]
MVSYLNRRKFLIFLFLVAFGGCAKPSLSLEKTTPKIIFFSTKDFRFYDTGLIKSYSNGDISLEIFNAGHLLLEFYVSKNRICLNQQCYATASLIRKLFGNDGLLELDFKAILEGREIFMGKNKKILKEGYEQRINDANNQVVYKVTTGTISFKELKSGFSLIISGI